MSIFKGNKRKRILGKANGKCWYCGCDLASVVACIDHIVPALDGGSDEDSNLVPCCRYCNSAKGTRTIEDLRRYLALPVKFSPEQWDFLEYVGGTTIQDIKRLVSDYRFYFEQEGLEP